MSDFSETPKRMSYSLLHQECEPMHHVQIIYQHLIVLLVFIFFMGLFLSTFFFPIPYLWDQMEISTLIYWDYYGIPNLISPIIFDITLLIMAMISFKIANIVIQTQCQQICFRICGICWVFFGFGCLFVAIPIQVVHGMGASFFIFMLIMLVLSLYDPRFSIVTALFFVMILLITGIFLFLYFTGLLEYILWQKILVFSGLFAILVHPYVSNNGKN